MFITGSSDILPLPPVTGRNDVNKIEASKQSFQSDPAVREDVGVRYFSPVVRIDPESQQAIIIFRQADGEIVRQYPSEKELEAYRENRLAASQNSLAAKPPSQEGGDKSEQSAAAVIIGTGGKKSRSADKAPVMHDVSAPDNGSSTKKTETPDNGNIVV